jgi:CRISPR-associated endonuclease/helicase Cas3
MHRGDWFAHSGNNPDFSDGERLEDHASKGAACVEAFGEVPGISAPAKAGVRLHDVGKAIPEFQDYIRPTGGVAAARHAGSGPEHSSAGAVIAHRHYKGFWRIALAFAIAGHHTGLANGRTESREGGPSPLTNRLQAKVPASVEEAAQPLLEAGNWPEPPRGDAFARSFAIRMLFSHLVDADRLATEAFYKAVPRGCDVSLNTLRDTLNTHLAGLAQAAEADSARDPALRDVNTLRADVLRQVRGRAGEEPGLFQLTVPTGGGKTLTSLAFALDHAVLKGKRRVIYVIPFTSIVEQTAKVFRAALKNDDAILEHHSAFDAERLGKQRDAEDPSRLAAENWDIPVVVTTAVQFFESLFSNRTGPCRKLHNIANSVIVLDEAQTLPLKLLRPCLAAIRELAARYGCTVVLCTATQPSITAERDDFKGGLTNVRELVDDREELYRKLERVTVTREPDPLDVPALVERLRGEREVLCIVNNRRHARDLYDALEGVAGRRILTTALCAKHRQRVLEEIRATLNANRGKAPEEREPVILIATSLIEAGVDVSFPAVYRAMAGLDSIAQAAGRCNRHGELGPKGGRVTVFTPADHVRHKPPPELEAFAETAGKVMDRFPDPLAPDTLKRYFQRVYWSKDGHGELDRIKIGERVTSVEAELHDYADTDLYPFADIGDAFRVIDSPLVPVVVPWGEHAAKVKGHLDSLRFVESAGGIARELQPFTVQIPRNARANLLKAGAAEVVGGERFGDAFVRLINMSLYHPEAGLHWDDPTFFEMEMGML